MTNREALRLKVGDYVFEIPSGFDVVQRCKVVYIHPKHRFYMVEFRGEYANTRECYHFPPDIVRCFR